MQTAQSFCLSASVLHGVSLSVCLSVCLSSSSSFSPDLQLFFFLSPFLFSIETLGIEKKVFIDIYDSRIYGSQKDLFLKYDQWLSNDIKGTLYSYPWKKSSISQLLN